jgi:hypothetical protein
VRSGLPANLTINSSTGLISGTLQTAGSFNVTVTATDSVGGTSGAQPYTLTINPANPPLNFSTPSPLPNGTVGVAYSQGMVVTGGTGSYTFSTTSGSLPAGLGLNSGTGDINGAAQRRRMVQSNETRALRRPRSDPSRTREPFGQFTVRDGLPPPASAGSA